jgi:hypothetical protein
VTHTRSSAAHGWVGHAVAGGIAAGIVGALVLTFIRVEILVVLFLPIWLVFGSNHAEIARSEIWAAVKLPAYLFVGERALGPGLDTPIVWLGIVTHLVFSIAWGALFGLLAHGRSGKAIVALGILWGIVVWAVDSYLILPSLGAVIVFIPYGLAIALTFLWWERRSLPPPQPA